MDENLRSTLTTHFSNEELTQIESFLDRGFSKKGQIVITSIFLYANEAQKPVEEVLRACQTEWERNWQYQHPDIKGDADAPGGAGVQNRASLEIIYSTLVLPSPFATGKQIPQEVIVVTTENSVYRFGEADDEGGRTVSRDNKPFDLTRCRIAFLAIGNRMELIALDGPHAGVETSLVRSIA